MKAFDFGFGGAGQSASSGQESMPGLLGDRPLTGKHDFSGKLRLTESEQLIIKSETAERQKFHVATNFFALACPIMPIGLLGAFMFLGGLDNLAHKNDLLDDGTDESVLRGKEAAQAMYLLAMKKKMEADKRRVPLSCSRPVDHLTGLGEKLKGKPRKEVTLQTQGKRSEQISGPSLLTKEQKDVGKIVKQKMALESHLEKVNKEQDFQSSARVSAKIDQLEKALKRLGA